MAPLHGACVLDGPQRAGEEVMATDLEVDEAERSWENAADRFGQNIDGSSPNVYLMLNPLNVNDYFKLLANNVKLVIGVQRVHVIIQLYVCAIQTLS